MIVMSLLRDARRVHRAERTTRRRQTCMGPATLAVASASHVESDARDCGVPAQEHVMSEVDVQALAHVFRMLASWSNDAGHGSQRDKNHAENA